MTNTASFNLIDEAWIPVLWRNGRAERVGIRTALTEAGGIRQIAASNPMDNVALLRFLLAVLLWCKPELEHDDRTQLDNAEGIPGEWLTEKVGTAEMPSEAFNLFGDAERFYQDKSILDDLLKAKQKKWDDQRKKAKLRKAPKTPRPSSLDDDDFRPIGDLLIEFPTETKIVHFCHVRDKGYGLCPACCALGVIRFCAWANAYGGGRYTSGVNGPTPAYAVPHGRTLLETLVANWPKWIPDRSLPPWLSKLAPTAGDLNVVTVFAWRSRRLWLSDPQESQERCRYCGQLARLIKQHAFTGNWKPPFETKGQQKKFWQEDPHLILVDKAQAAEDDEDSIEADGVRSTRQQNRGASGDVKKTTLGFPLPGSKVAMHSRFWRRVLSAKVVQLNKTVAVTVTGPAANKGLYQDAANLWLPHVWQQEVIELMSKAVDGLSGVLCCSSPNPQRQHPEFKATLDLLSPSLEVHLRQEVNERLERQRLREAVQVVVEGVVSATTSGSPLRRREAMKRAKLALDKAIRRVNASPEKKEPTEDKSQVKEADISKPKGGGKKKEDAI